MKNKTAKKRNPATILAVECNSKRVSTERFVLYLYIAGLSPRSTLAVERIRGICDRYLQGRYELTVVDLFVNPEIARQAQIIVAPTLIKLSPSPKRVFVGDMSDERQFLLDLNIVV